MKKIVPMLFLSFIVTTALFGSEIPTQAKLRTLYNSLDPLSVSQHLAFYELYPQTDWGQKALNEAWRLLAGRPAGQQSISAEIFHSNDALNALVQMVNKPIDQELPLLDHQTILHLQKLSARLPHHSLKGHHVWSEEQVLTLPLQEIDLARGLFITQFGEHKQKIETYEAMIDLMALQILARLSVNATSEEKIIAINTFIFDELGFRFPPHSLSTKDIDLYSFLPSVIDSRRGVCLGVSILYLCIAQRLSLPLEMITPPGHIYVRYRDKDHTINIETTARGIHLDSDEYLGINNRALQQRTILEVIGMAHFNQAAGHWQTGDHAKALQAYRKAQPYMKNDPVLKELMGYILILTGNREEGEKNLKEIKDFIPEHEIVKNTMAEDYLKGHVDAEGIGAIFKKADPDRPSLLAKKEGLEKTLQKYPRFRAGLLNLAVTWLQLHRMGEALDTLIQYQKLDQGDPEAQYYLAVLYAERRDFPNAWHHIKKAEDIVKAHNYDPKSLKELRRELLTSCPEP